MAVFRVREYTNVGRNANSSPIPLPLEPPLAVTEMNTTGGEQTLTLQASTSFVIVELWTGTLATGLRYHLTQGTPSASGSEAGLILTGRLPLARGCAPGSKLALEEAA